MRGILAFWLPHYPLALTSVITMSTAPLLTFSLGRGRDPLQCLAIWQLVYAFVFFFRSGGGRSESAVPWARPEAPSCVIFKLKTY